MEEKKLLKYAIDYLSKYDSSKRNLLNILKRKISRIKINTKEKNVLEKSIQNILLILEKNDFINDKRYSLLKISSLARTGKSQKFIISYLIKKGINMYDIQECIEEYKNNNDNWELNAAKQFASKKKLLISSESYEKKLSKLARAGFSYDICKKILN